ncbi:MAG: hypothetical protein ABSB42_22015 [Tepidisphaeraceae bacterium]|jgi:hypothetical protein
MHPLKQIGIQIMFAGFTIGIWLILATRGQIMTPERIALLLMLASMISVGLRLVFPDVSRTAAKCGTIPKKEEPIPNA